MKHTHSAPSSLQVRCTGDAGGLHDSQLANHGHPLNRGIVRASGGVHSPRQSISTDAQVANSRTESHNLECAEQENDASHADMIDRWVHANHADRWNLRTSFI